MLDEYMRLFFTHCNPESQTGRKRFERQMSWNVRNLTFDNICPKEDSIQPAHPRSLISLRCPHEEILHPLQSKMRTVKILIGL